MGVLAVTGLRTTPAVTATVVTRHDYGHYVDVDRQRVRSKVNRSWWVPREQFCGAGAK